MKKIVCSMMIIALLIMSCSCFNESQNQRSGSAETTSTSKEDEPTNTPTPKPTRTPTPTPRSSSVSTGRRCCNHPSRPATHGVYCDDCYYDRVQNNYNNGISQNELHEWANGNGWYDDDYYW